MGRGGLGWAGGWRQEEKGEAWGEQGRGGDPWGRKVEVKDLSQGDRGRARLGADYYTGLSIHFCCSFFSSPR